MKKKVLSLLATFALVSVAFALLVVAINPARGADSTAASPGRFVCGTGLSAGIYHGPDSPIDLSGYLTLYVQPDLTFTGTLALKKDGSTVGVRGQGVGRGIDMVFMPASGKELFAHGALEYSLAECKGNGGGTLTGPADRDLGDWTNYPPFIRVISGTIR
jgi:hypothetical protein